MWFNWFVDTGYRASCHKSHPYFQLVQLYNLLFHPGNSYCHKNTSWQNKNDRILLLSSNCVNHCKVKRSTFQFWTSQLCGDVPYKNTVSADTCHVDCHTWCCCKILVIGVKVACICVLLNTSLFKTECSACLITVALWLFWNLVSAVFIQYSAK